MKLTMTGGKDMKLLKIESNLGHFLNKEDDFDLIEKITKEDLLRLANLTLENEVEFDEFDEELIKNQAHQIVYKSVYDKLYDLKERKKEFVDESERMYLSEHERYREEHTQQES